MAHLTRTDRLFIRADASSRIGNGHVMRCIALAQAWKMRGGAVTFLGRLKGKLVDRVIKEGFDHIPIPEPYPSPLDLETTRAAITEGGVSDTVWLALDGYHFDEAYQQAFCGLGCRLLVIDDLALLSRYGADIILNQNISAGDLEYPADCGAQFLFGPRYALIRVEFQRWRDTAKKHSPNAERVLITMGGADPDNVTLSAIEALKKCRVHGLFVKVLIGSSNPHRKSLARACASQCLDIQLIENTEKMPELMAWADMAVSGGGVTCWEMAFMGLPNLVVVLAENQKVVAKTLRSVGCSSVLNYETDFSESGLLRELDSLIPDRERRKKMSERGRGFIDGLGGQRVIDTILNVCPNIAGGAL